MNKTNDIDNHFSERILTLKQHLENVERADSNDEFHAFSDELVEYLSDGLAFVDPDTQPPTEVVEDSGDSANLSAQEADRPHGSITVLRPESRADGVAALSSKQLTIERQEQKNRKSNTRMRELRSFVRPPEDRPAHGAEENANLRARLDGGGDYLQALNTQTGKLETMLDSLTQTHTWLAELNAALDEDLNGCNQRASKMQADKDQLAELESLVDQLCSADPSGNEIRQNAVETEPANVDFLETLAELHVKDLKKLPEVHVKDRESCGDNRLFIAMNDAIKCRLNNGVVTIGRGQSNDIQIRSRCVSRSHARIVTNNSDAIIEDLNSKNGITVNGSDVQLKQLINGDVVGVDNIYFTFIDLMPDGADRGHRSANDGAANSACAADRGGESAQEMRDRRDRRNRRNETQADYRSDREPGQDGFQDAEGRPDRDMQSAKTAFRTRSSDRTATRSRPRNRGGSSGSYVRPVERRMATVTVI